MAQQMNMQKMMQQARKMQEEVERAQAEVALLEATGTVGGGVVSVVANGSGRVKSVTIDPSAVDAEDVELLEDLVLAAVNEALSNVSELASLRMEAATGGFNLPGF